MNYSTTQLHSGLEIAAILLLLFSAMLDPRLTVGLSAVLIVAVVVEAYATRGTRRPKEEPR